MDHSSETGISAWLTATERQVSCIGDAKVARLRRHFDFSHQEIWNACTDRDQLPRWFANQRKQNGTRAIFGLRQMETARLWSWNIVPATRPTGGLGQVRVGSMRSSG